VLCVYCHGKGTVQSAAGPQPCAECGGSGLLHCCEGLQAQPESGKENRSQEHPLWGADGDGSAK
jgi:DnaJ-class molecular chaperone